jgi:hypothetical protein
MLLRERQRETERERERERESERALLGMFQRPALYTPHAAPWCRACLRVRQRKPSSCNLMFTNGDGVNGLGSEESDAPKEALGKRKRDDADSPSKKKLK